MITVYISIGNSDNNLTQLQWSDFVDRVRQAVKAYAVMVHGQWYSASDSRWQNAAFCLDIRELKAATLQAELARIAADFRQDSIAWAVAETEFITAGGSEG